MVIPGQKVASSVVKETGEDFDVLEVLRELEEEMQEAATSLEFERAALLRDQITELKKRAGMETSDKGRQQTPAKRKKVKYRKGGE